MKNLQHYFTEDQLVELKKIVRFIVAGDINIAGELLKGLSLYDPFLKFLTDTYTSTPPREQRGIVNLFGNTLYYDLCIRVEDGVLPQELDYYIEGKYGTYVLALKDRIGGGEQLLMGVAVKNQYECKLIVYDNAEVKSSNLEKCLFYGEIAGVNPELLNCIPNSIKHLNLLVVGLSESMEEPLILKAPQPLNEENPDDGWEDDSDEVLGECLDASGEMWDDESEQLTFSDEANRLLIDLSDKQCLETLFLRYSGDVVRPINYPKSLQYLRCVFNKKYLMYEFLESEMRKLAQIKGLTIALCAENEAFCMNIEMLNKYGFSYNNDSGEFIAKI